MKILSASTRWTAAQIFLDGQPVQIHNPHHAQQLGISIIYQEFNLMPNLTVMENIFIGREPGRLSSSTATSCEASPGTARPAGRAPVARLPSCATCPSPNSRWWRSPRRSRMQVKVLIMDEPTSALSEAEVQTLFDIMRDLQARRHQRDLHFAPAGRGGRRSATGSPCCATAAMSARWRTQEVKRRRTDPHDGGPLADRVLPPRRAAQRSGAARPRRRLWRWKCAG